MSNSIDKSKYEHYVPEAKRDDGFPGNYKFTLIKSIDELEEVLSRKFNYMAFDTETNSLDPEPAESHLVGFSFCFDGKEAFYVPVHHFSGGIGYEAVGLIYERMCQCKQVFMYNARFDMRWMEYAGYDMSKVAYYDVQLAVILADTNVTKGVTLKWAERHFLGWEPDTFSETLGDASNFYFVEPENACFYAATDALGTFNLARVTLQYYVEGRLSAKIENNVLYPMMKMEDMPLVIDVDWLNKCNEVASEKIRELESRIFATVGYVFEINSNKQKSDALSSLGITTGAMTKTGNMAVSAKVFDSLIDRYKKANEAVPQIVLDLAAYSKMVKLKSSYIEALIFNAQRHNNRLRFSYKIGKVPTGRLACGTDKGNDYFAKVNLQSIPKPHPKMWYYREAVPESNPEFTILGWEFSMTPFGPVDDAGNPTDPNERWCEGKDPTLNIRSAFPAGKGRYWVSIDYHAQEIVIPTNLTLDPSFVNSFLTGGDCHTDTAIQMFGAENYNKEKRKIAKTFNFGLLYGMSTYSVAERYHIPLETAEKWVNLYKTAHRQVFTWVDALNKKAKKEGTVYNYFGRPRRVKFYLQSSDPKQRSFGYRTVVNTSVQSVGADCTKLALCRYWSNVYNNPKYIVPKATEADEFYDNKNHANYKDGFNKMHRKVIFASTIHDEVNSLIDKDVAREAIADCIKAQRFKFRGWPVPMDIGLEVGNIWGLCFPFKCNQETGEVYEPDGTFVHEEREDAENDETKVAETEEIGTIDFDFNLDD